MNFQATAEFDSGDAQDPVRAQRIYDAVTFSVLQPWHAFSTLYSLRILYVFAVKLVVSFEFSSVIQTA